MSLGQTVIAVGAVATSLATLSVCLRCISRFWILRKSSMDDYLIMASIALSWILYGFVAAQVPYGLGKHYTKVPMENFVMILKYTWVCSYMYNLALTTTKLSAIFQFLRFAVAPRSRTAGYTLMAIISAYGTAVSLGFVFSCHPIAFYWNKTIRNGQCVDIVKFSICNVILNVATDLAVVALPLHVLKDLRLSKRDKLAVQSTFAVGGLTCFTSVFRLYFLYINGQTLDYTHNIANVGIWSVIELNTGISCTCVPTIRPLAQQFVPRLFTTRSSPLDRTQSSNSTGLEPIKAKHSRGSRPNDDLDTLIRDTTEDVRND